MKFRNRQPATSMLLLWGESASLKSFEIIKAVRSCGLIAETDVVGRGLRAQMKYADKIGAKFSMVLGDNEIEQGKAVIKNMSSGEQTEIVLDDTFAENLWYFSLPMLTALSCKR